MNVIASKRGYFGRLIEAGEVFTVPDGAQASWFAPVVEPAPEASAPEAQAPVASGRGRKKVEAPVPEPAPAPEEPAPG